MNDNSQNNKEEIKIKNEIEEEENDKHNSNINLNESSSSDSDSESEKKNKSLNSSSNDDVESVSSSIDEERLTLGQISKLARRAQRRKEEINIREYLRQKRHLDSNAITYDEKKGKILNEFCGSIEELKDFLNKCEVKKIDINNFSKEKDSIIFDPNKWLKDNNIDKRTISLEDLQVYYQEKEPKKKEKERKEDNEKKEKIQKKEIKRSYYLKDKKINEDYDNLKKIIKNQKLSKEQKEWISNLISKIKRIEINNINIEKNSEGKYNKLELVFDLDNTCIYSFLSNTDVLLVQKKKNIIPKKDVRMISFKFNNKVLYTALIIRKGLKEFLQYISPLCNFHISTLGAESYGNEVKDILGEYAGVEFIRYKGRIYINEVCKNISDLYINNENTVIFDDYIRVWENNNNDYEQVIPIKYFYDEECASLNNNIVENNISEENGKKETELFLKSYRTMCYDKIMENNLDKNDWKKHEIKEYSHIPFYQFKSNDDYDYNKCFTAEYLDSPKLQFDYMKEVIKVIYCLKFIFEVDIRIAIKLIKICTLNNMVFDLKHLADDQKLILSDMIKVCGGMIYDKNYNYINSKEKIYLVISKRFYESKKEKIKVDLQQNKNYILINEKFILDTYYFMTDIRNHINDPEYIVE